MRLGSWPCRLAEDSFALRRLRRARDQRAPSPSLRVQSRVRGPAEGRAACGSPARRPDSTYVEICEIADHPWYLGCQFHPEFKSKPMEPHPLFKAFIGAADEQRDRRSRPMQEPLRRGAAVLPCRLSSRDFGRRAAGADRRALRHRKRRARPPHGARHPRSRWAPFVFKASLRQGQPHQRRTPIAGPGLQEGLRILAGVKARGLPDPDRHPRAVRRPSRRPRSADILQIPAFLCRQTDLLIAAGRTGPHRQHQEGPVRGAARHPPRGGEGGVHGQHQGRADRARLVASATTIWWWICAA